MVLKRLNLKDEENRNKLKAQEVRGRTTMKNIWYAFKRILYLPMDCFFILQNRMRIKMLWFTKNVVVGRGVRIVPLSHFRVGRNTAIDQGTVLDCGGLIWNDYKGGIVIGESSYIGYNSVLLGGGDIRIGNKVLISPGCVLTTQGHFFKGISGFMKDQPTQLAKIVIGDDVWIGANSTILPGVTIGKGSVIGAGSVVNKDVPEYSVAWGIPAKVIRKRD